MSILLFLEVEAGADLDAVLRALDSIQAEYSDGTDCTDGLRGYLPASNTGFGFGIVDPPEALAAEGIEAEWQVGLLGSFHFRASGFESAWEEICRFIKRYAAMWGSGLCSRSSSRASMRQGSGRIWSFRGLLHRNAGYRSGRPRPDLILTISGDIPYGYNTSVGRLISHLSAQFQSFGSI